MIYIDSDGVLSDFEGWILSHSKDREQLLSRIKRGEYPVEIFEILRNYYKEAYVEAPLIEENRYLLEYLNRDDCFILTALPSRSMMRNVASDQEIDKMFEIWRENKVEWFENLGISYDKVIVLESSHDKGKFASKDNILIDDFERNCKEWREEGGIAIKIPNKWY